MMQLQPYYNTITAVLWYNYSHTVHYTVAVLQQPYIQTMVQLLLRYTVIMLWYINFVLINDVIHMYF